MQVAFLILIPATVNDYPALYNTIKKFIFY